MRLSFDLDGVVCDGDSNVLGILHQQVLDGVPYGQVRLRHYYLTRRLALDPRDFAAPGDEIHIVTGRSQLTHGWTRDWLARWLPEAQLHFAATAETETLFSEGRYDEGSQVMGVSKAGILKRIGAELHLDNNPRIVQRLRSEGILAVLVGRALP